MKSYYLESYANTRTDTAYMSLKKGQTMDHIYRQFTGNGDDWTILQYLKDYPKPPKTLIIDNIQKLAVSDINNLELFMKDLISYGKIILCSSSVFVTYGVIPD